MLVECMREWRKPHTGLKGKTPAEAAEIRVDDKDKRLIWSLIFKKSSRLL